MSFEHEVTFRRTVPGTSASRGEKVMGSYRYQAVSRARGVSPVSDLREADSSDAGPFLADKSNDSRGFDGVDRLTIQIKTI